MPRVRSRPRAHAAPAPYGSSAGNHDTQANAAGDPTLCPDLKGPHAELCKLCRTPQTRAAKKKHEAASVEGEIGLRDAVRPKRPRGSGSWEARTGAAGLGALYEFFRAPSFLSFWPPPRAPPRFSPGRTAQQGYKAQS